MAKLKRFKDINVGDKVYSLSNDNNIDILIYVGNKKKKSVFGEDLMTFEFKSTVNDLSSSMVVIQEKELNSSVLYRFDFNLFSDKQQVINVLKKEIESLNKRINFLYNEK